MWSVARRCRPACAKALPDVSGCCQRAAQRGGCFDGLAYQRGVVGGHAAVLAQQVVFKADARVAAKQRGSSDAGVFCSTKGAHGPGLWAFVGGQERQQVARAGGLPRAVAAQHKQQEPGGVGHYATGAQRLPAAQVGHVVQDDLHHGVALRQVGKKALQTCLANLGLVDFAQADGHGLGLQGFDHGDLRRCLVDACGLAGDLDHHGIAYGLAYHALGLAVALHIEAMVAPRIADVHVQHRGSCVQAGLGRGGQRGWRDGYGRVVGGLFVGTVGRHGHDQRIGPLVVGGGRCTHERAPVVDGVSVDEVSVGGSMVGNSLASRARPWRSSAS